jgi:hypothetical protein
MIEYTLLKIVYVSSHVSLGRFLAVLDFNQTAKPVWKTC